MTLDYKPLRKELMKERQRVEDLIAAETERRSVITDTSDNEVYSNHPGDEGSETFEKEKSVALQANLQVILNEVDHALEKMDSGTYGRCDECGKQIPYERLEVRPQATLCIECKTKLEHSALAGQIEPTKAFV